MRRILAAAVLAATVATVASCASTPPPVPESVQKYYDENANKISEPSPTREPLTLKPVPAGAQVLFLGDSYTEGYGTTNMAKDNFARTLARTRGWDAVVDGIGGTGFINGGPAGARDYRSRIENLSVERALNPALVVIEGGLNDWESTTKALWEAVEGTVKLARLKWPEAQIVVIGPTAGSPENQSLTEGVGAVRNGANLAGVPFIDVSKLVTPVNDKALAFEDGYHLNTQGHAAMAALIDAEMAKLTS